MRGHDDVGTGIKAGIKDRERTIAALDELAENPFQAMAYMRDYQGRRGNRSAAPGRPET